MFANADTQLDAEQLGSPRPYRKTFPYEGDWINARHRYYAECPREGVLIQVGIEGWLQPDDALKLYELAYFAEGDVLELGTHRGLSTSILAQASRDRGRPRRIVAVDLDPSLLEDAERTLRERDLAREVRFLLGDAAATCRQLREQGRRFGLVFVDHCHAFEPVLGVCRELAGLVAPGGFCLFHDYNDPSNRPGGPYRYGVYDAVVQGLDRDAFEFFGAFGCAALFRRRSD